MRNKGAGLAGALAFLVVCIAGCIEVPLEPETLELKAQKTISAESVDLFVIFRSSIGGPDRKTRWAVFVDGETRAWLPEASCGYTRIAVPPGRHEVIVGNRMRSYVAPIPIPLSSDDQIKKVVTCGDGTLCGMTIYMRIGTWTGLRMSAELVPADHVEDSIKGLTFCESDR